VRHRKNPLVTSEAVATAMEVVASLASAKVITQAPPSTNTPMEVEPDLLECLDSLSDQLNVTAVGHSTV
jgi:peptidyl-tRNA hydrolase